MVGDCRAPRRAACAAAAKACSTRPPSATVVPAMSRTTSSMVSSVISSVTSPARRRSSRRSAGEQVMPRPPGPVTSQTPSRTCWRWTTRRCRCTARRPRPSGAGCSAAGGRGRTRRRARGARTAPRRRRRRRGRSYSWVSPMVSPPSRRCTISSCILCAAAVGACGCPRVEGVERVAPVGRVVAEAVGVGDGGGQRFAERVGLHHLQPDAAHRQIGAPARGRGRRARRRCTATTASPRVQVAVVVAHGGRADDLADLAAAAGRCTGRTPTGPPRSAVGRSRGSTAASRSHHSAPTKSPRSAGLRRGASSA